MNRINMTDENWATAIKIAAVMVAVPRWIGALLEADGVPLLLTSETAPWWGLFSAIASAGMALVEGIAFWYTLRAWRQHGGKLLGVLIAMSMAAFAIVLTPYIMAQVSKQALSDVLAGDWLIVWAGCVSLSTILIVASVGYAQPRKVSQDLSTDKQPAQVPSTGETDEPVSVTGDDTGYNASQSRQNGTSSAVVVENDESTTDASSEAQNAVSELDTIEARLAQVQLTGKYTVDMVNCLLAVPEAKSAQLAAYIGCSRQHVDNTLNKWEQAKKISKNGQVKFIEPVNN